MLWNNAGYQGQIKPTLEYDPADFSTVLNINVTGMFIVLQTVAKNMAASGGGTIVNTASVADWVALLPWWHTPPARRLFWP